MLVFDIVMLSKLASFVLIWQNRNFLVCCTTLFYMLYQLCTYNVYSQSFT